MLLTNKLQTYTLPNIKTNPKDKLVVLPETNFLINAKHSILPDGDILEVFKTKYDTVAFHPHNGRIYVNGHISDSSTRNRIYSSLGLRTYRDDYLNRSVITAQGRTEELIIERSKVTYKLGNNSIVLDYDSGYMTTWKDDNIIKTINNLPNSIENIKLLIYLINELMEGK